MANPFEDPQAHYLVLVNAEDQYSLWPAFAAVPAGWDVAHGRAARGDCVEFIEHAWAGMRPRTLIAAVGEG